MSTALYLAYGSNLHPLRLKHRLPNSQLLARVNIRGYQLCFHKHGGDDSGKCDLVRATSDAVAYGALYQLVSEDLVALDHWEGGYERRQWSLNWNNKTQDVHTYIAHSDKITQGIQPYNWYQQLVLTGGEFFGFPEEYLAMIRAYDHKADPDPQRHSFHQRLLDEMYRHNDRTGVIERSWLTLEPATELAY